MSDQATAPRVYSPEDRMLPRIMVRAMLALVLAALAIATYARITDRPLVSTPLPAEVRAQAEVTLRTAGETGAVVVHDHTGAVVADLSPEEGGFIAGVQRSIERERLKHRLPREGAVILTAYENGRLSIEDPATGWSAELLGFGIDNTSAFARVLAATQKGN